MDKHDIEDMAAAVEAEDSIFASKVVLDAFTSPPKIIGREEKARELVKLLSGHKKGFVVPFISVYGRSGSGKSIVSKFVCENMPGVEHCFVNLRRAKTIFGCCNLILAGLGQPNLKSAQGINYAIEKISESIQPAKGGLFVLVLDEFDVIFSDRRNRPSDFIYKLMVMEEKLREKGVLVTIVAISNNVMADYEIDDRVRSRIGSSEVFFDAYPKKAIMEILQDRAARAFLEPVDNEVLQYCADMSSGEHGDARRAIDLLRVAAEVASNKKEKLGKAHVDMASDQLQKDRLQLVLSAASYHLKLAAAALARLTFMAEQPWHSTSTIYDEYKTIMAKDTKPLGYRRVSELLTELANTGIAISDTSSKGRQGYGTEYKLTVAPEVIGKVCFPQWWDGVVSQKELDKRSKEFKKAMKSLSSGSILGRRRRRLNLSILDD